MSRRSKQTQTEYVKVEKPLDEIREKAKRYGYSDMFPFVTSSKVARERTERALETRDFDGLLVAYGMAVNYLAYELAKRDGEVDRLKYEKRYHGNTKKEAKAS